jgi:hypothetical protein
MNAHRRSTFVALGCVGAAMVASLGAASPTASKQRIAIVERIDLSTIAGTFELIPLSPGPLKHDSGSVAGTGAEGRSIIRDGQRVTPITGVDTMTSSRGTFQVSQKVGRVEVADGSGLATGAWSIKNGTGVYATFVGSGRFAGIDSAGTNSGRLLIRQEGYVRKS